MKKNDPIFDDVKSGKKNDTRFVYFKRKGKGKSETFTSEDLKKAFE